MPFTSAACHELRPWPGCARTSRQTPIAGSGRGSRRLRRPPARTSRSSSAWDVCARRLRGARRRSWCSASCRQRPVASSLPRHGRQQGRQRGPATHCLVRAVDRASPAAHRRIRVARFSSQVRDPSRPLACSLSRGVGKNANPQRNACPSSIRTRLSPIEGTCAGIRRRQAVSNFANRFG